MKNQGYYRQSGWAIALTTALLSIQPSPIQAQLIPDNSLGAENSRITPNILIQGLPSDQIDGGAARGVNLFHSFRDFNVANGQRVYFANPNGISNILTRVTGNSPSEILGRLGVNGGANLFLLNPHGILFGSNSSLDIRGSFTASTANSFTFPNGEQFSATNPNAPPLLTINVPIGLQRGDQPVGDITNAGNLTVDSGQSLTLFGNTVTSTGLLTAPGGMVQILGNYVGLFDNAKIDVSSPTGGGTVLVGGDFQGKGTVPNAKRTFVDSGVIINANAANNGNGGRVIIWADEVTRFSGKINAQGGVDFGNGGFAEVSGKESLLYRGNIDVSASNGSFGSVLFDPKNITIAAGGTDPISANDAFAENSAASVTFDAAQINALSGNVVLQANNDITVNQAISLGFITSLTLQSGRSIFINQNIRAGDFKDLYLLANSSTSDGVIDAQREPGDAVIKMAPGTSLRGGGIYVLLESGTGLTNSSAGDIYLENLINPLVGSGGGIFIQGPNNVALKQASAYGSNSIRDTITIEAGKSVDANNIFAMGGASKSISIEAGDVINANNLFAQGGDIFLKANGSVYANRLTTSPSGGRYNRYGIGSGDIILRSGENIITNGLSSSAGGVSGTIDLKASGSIRAYSLITKSNGIDTGDIVLDAQKDIYGGEFITSGSASSGQIKISTPGNINTTSGSLVTSGPVGSGAITLKSGGDISTSSIMTDSLAGSGNIEIDALGIFSSFNSRIITDTKQFDQSGDIKIKAESVFLNNTQVSAIASGKAQSGNIKIIINDIFDARQGSSLQTTTFGSGQAGNIEVLGSTINIVDPNSGFFADTQINSSGNGGKISVYSQDLAVQNGARITTETRGNGRAGNLDINSQNSVIVGGSSTEGLSSEITARTFSSGDGGNLKITAGSLSVNDGAQISAYTLGTGQAGTLMAVASDFITIVGTSSSGLSSSLSFDTSSSGNAGDLRIETGRLLLKDGGQVTASTSGSGRGGIIAVNATDFVEVSGALSGLYFDSRATGDARGINIKTDQLMVRDGGQITVSGSGVGKAGDLDITAGSVFLDNQAELTATTVSSQGGNIRLQNLNTLTMDRNSRISASAVSGQGGTVNISASNSIDISGGSRISAEAMGNGSAGSLQLYTGQLRIQDGGRLVVSSDGSGNAGNLTVQADEISVRDRGRITATTASGEGGNIQLQAKKLIILRRDSDIRTQAFGTGNGGNIRLEAGVAIVGVLSEDSDVIASAVTGRGGNIFAKAPLIVGFRLFDRVETSESDFVASSEFGIDGVVTLDTRNPQPNTPPSDRLVPPPLVQGCAAAPGVANRGRPANQFFYAGRGGLPPNPSEALSSSALWEDGRSLSVSSTPSAPQKQVAAPTAIIEATGWVREADGVITLVADGASSNPSFQASLQCDGQISR